mgnify:CR=1 FL=1
MYLIKTPLLLKKLYPNHLIWNKSREDKSIFLTFDDGPIPIVTPWVLKTLKNFEKLEKLEKTLKKLLKYWKVLQNSEALQKRI